MTAPVRFLVWREGDGDVRPRCSEVGAKGDARAMAYVVPGRRVYIARVEEALLRTNERPREVLPVPEGEW